MLNSQQVNAPLLPSFHTEKWILPEFVTELGNVISDVEIAYETYGVINTLGTNVIWLCHALTGDAHAADTNDQPGWWGALIGAGRAIDTERYFVVSANVLGGCAGTTGPSSLKLGSTEVYGAAFPEITIRDMVSVQKALADHLQVNQIQAVIGGSMGGMQALEWAIMYPNMIQNTVVIAADPEFSPMGIAYNDVMRQAIVADPQYHEGDYWKLGVFPEQGLRVARMLGMITYRTAALFQERFARQKENGEFQVNRYLRYQGDKLVKRFDAQSYLTLLQAMDTHDIGRDRGGLEAAFSLIRARLVWVGIDDDLLYPANYLQQAVAVAKACGVNARYEHIHSPFGHDAFLIEWEQLQQLIIGVLENNGV